MVYQVGGGWDYRDGPGAGYMDGPRLLRMRFGELVPHSLGWNCALGIGG